MLILAFLNWFRSTYDDTLGWIPCDGIDDKVNIDLGHAFVLQAELQIYGVMGHGESSCAIPVCVKIIVDCLLLKFLGVLYFTTWTGVTKTVFDCPS